jgi:hypothetical protein
MDECERILAPLRGIPAMSCPPSQARPIARRILSGVGKPLSIDIYSHVMPNIQGDGIANFNIALDPVK